MSKSVASGDGKLRGQGAKAAATRSSRKKAASPAKPKRPAAAKPAAPQLLVNLEEFADLCGVTAETMRVYVRALDPQPGWLIERGDRGRGYKIEPEGGIAWWKSKRAEEESASVERQEALRQLRFEHLGDAAEGEEALSLSGKQRREEYQAVLDRIKLRRTMGELIEISAIEPLLANAAIEARRRFGLIAGEYAATMGLSPEEMRPLADMIERAAGEFVDSLSAALET